MEEEHPKVSLKKVIIVAVVIIIFILLSLFQGTILNKDSGDSVLKHKDGSFDEFYDAFNRNDLDRSVTEAREIIDGSPDDALGYLALASVYLQKGIATSDEELYIGLALELIQKALAIDPNNSDAYRLLAHVHEMRMEFDKALEMYAKAYSLNKFDDLILTSRGHLYYIIGNDVLAEADYKRALEINDRNAQALTNLALLYMRTGQADVIDVEEILLRAIEIEKNHNYLAESYNALGVFYLVNRLYEPSIEMFRTAVAYDPGMIPAWNGIAMGSIYLVYEDRDNSRFDSMKQRLRDAVDAKNTVLEKNPGFSRGYLTKGILLGLTQNFDAEKLAYEEGLSYIDDDNTLGAQEKESVRFTFEDLLSTF